MDAGHLHQDALRLYEKGDFGGAAERLEQCLQLRPDDAEALNDLGTVYFVLGRASLAALCLSRALELRPDLAQARRNLAQLRRVAGTGTSTGDPKRSDRPGSSTGLEREPTPRPLGRALAAVEAAARATAMHQAAPDERAWMERIEGVRAQLEASTAAAERAGSQTTVGEITRTASKKPLWASLLFRLVRGLQPERCIEMGTCVGISGAYQAAALEINGGGRLVTLEGYELLVSVARGTFTRLGLAQVEVRGGRFENTLEQALVDLEPVDYVFVDGHHQEEPTLTYFEQIVPHLSDCATLVFDDIAWSEGMARAWARLVADERVTVAVDMGTIGICLLSRVPAPRRRYSLDLRSAARSRTVPRSIAG